MHAQMTILRDIIHAAAARGGDFRQICAELELAPQELNDSDRQVPFKPAAEVWDVAIRHTGDPLLGLHMGEELSPTILGLIGYLMQSSGTLLDAIMMVARYWEVFSSMSAFTVQEEAANIVVCVEPAALWQKKYPESARQSVELAFSGTIRLFKTLSGKRISPIEVSFTYPRRAVNEYERIFHTLIRFRAGRNSLSFRRDDLLCPVLSYDTSLFESFNRSLEQKVKSLKGRQRFADQLRQKILVEFKGQFPPIDIISASMHMTPRSLQRKLKEDGMTFRELVNGLKKEIARDIMRTQGYRVGELAEMLGYADSSSFRKAYKKWMIR
jgi:AraC-like DNA-binding protein